MNKFVSTALDIGTTVQTENGDKTFSTSLNRCVDFFFQAGAIRGQKIERTFDLFSAAYGENPDLASMIALWTRDVRGGAGERQTFRNILLYLEQHDFGRCIRLMHRIPELGRFDDLLIFKTKRAKDMAFAIYAEALNAGNGLAAKWAPRESSAKKAIAKELRAFLGWDATKYRKVIARMTKVVETQMCNREWPAINYEHVPSVASARYGKAFGRHDQERYAKYLEDAKKGEKKINTSTVYPYDVTKSSVPAATADTMWKNLPDYVPDDLSFLPIIDVSGSMTAPAGGQKGTVSCLDVSVSLGIYCAQRNKSSFKDLAMTFNHKPRFFQIPEGDIQSQVRFVKGSDREMHGSTDLDKAMDLILEIAVKGKVSQKDLPTHLLVLSDMEFNGGNGSSHWIGRGTTSVTERTKQKFREAGYDLPNIVWWNIQSRNGNVPVRANEQGMALVSGFSPTIMSSLLKGDMNPVSQMLATVDKERYRH